jgi:GNAT superfamily N-acetyltransferase
MIHRFLSEQSYWARGRSRAVVERTIRNSLCFGAYAATAQVGFARAITDRAVFAYLADVFVLPEFRGQGIGKRLVEAILAHPDLQDLQVMLLRTRDAHTLYEPFGFRPLTAPEEMLGKYAQ